MSKQNPKMIELARLSRGYTQKDLADLLPNLNQPNLSKVEKGLLIASDETLAKIAEVLNYPISFFYQQELQTPFSNIYFRKRATVPQKSLDIIFSQLRIILKGIDSMLDNIELKEYPKFTFDISDGWTPEAIAVRMRELLKIPPGPVKSLIKTLEEEGIIIYMYDTPEAKFDGLTAYTDKGVPVIFINKNMPNDRIRFTICHELFHLIAHIPCDVEPWRDVEDEANRFAPEFLMPRAECYQDLKTISYNKLTHLKSYWGVSKAAIIRRAKTLNLIDEATYKYLMVELGRRGERKNETGFVELDDPLILNEIIELLKGELNQTEYEISENMKLSVEEYSKYFELNSARVKVRVIRRAI